MQESLAKKNVTVVTDATWLPAGVGSVDEIGSGAVVASKHLGWLNAAKARGSIVAPSRPLSSGKDAAEDDSTDDSNVGDLPPAEDSEEVMRILSKYRGYCEQLCVVPNSGVESLIRQGRCLEAKRLSLAHCGLHDTGLVPISMVIVANRRLRILDVSDNCLSTVAVHLVVNCLQDNQTIRALNLADNVQINSRSFRPLLQCLLQKPHLEEIGLERVGLNPMENDVLLLQACKNRSTGPRGNLSDHRTLLLPQSASRNRVMEAAQRYRLFSPEGPQLHTETSTFPKSGSPVENWWEVTTNFEKAEGLHRRWALECKRIRKAIQRSEELKAAELRVLLQKSCCARWSILARLLLERQEDAIEHELMLILKKPLPKVIIEMELENTKIQFLINKLQTEDAYGTNHSTLLIRAQDRLGALEVQLKRIKKNKAMLKGIANVVTLAPKEAEIKMKMAQLIDVDTSKMSRQQKQQTAMQLCRLTMSSGLKADPALAAAAEAKIETCLNEVATKSRLMKRATQAGAELKLMGRFKGSVIDAVQEQAVLLEANLKQIIDESDGWETKFSRGDVESAYDRLKDLLDAAHIRHQDKEIHTDLIEEGESLLEKFEDFLHFEQEIDTKVRMLEHRVAKTLSSVTVHDQRKVETLEELWTELHEHVEAELPEGSPKVRASVLQMVQKQASIEKLKSQVVASIEILDNGAAVHGVAETEQVTLNDLLPLHGAFEQVPSMRKVNSITKTSSVKKTSALSPNKKKSMSVKRTSWNMGDLARSKHSSVNAQNKHKSVSKGEEPESNRVTCVRDPAKDEAVLRKVHQRMKQYGYKPNKFTCTVSDENAETNLHTFKERMRKLDITKDEEVIRLFSMLQPFTFANFRRLLTATTNS